MNDVRHRAACHDAEPDLFSPRGLGGPFHPQNRRAEAVCRRCDVIAACLTFAVDTGQDEGVWGGLDATERRKLYHCSPTTAPRVNSSTGDGSRSYPNNPTRSQSEDEE